MPLEPEALLNASLRDRRPVFRERGSGILTTLRTDNAPKVRFHATLGQKPEDQLALV